MRIEHSPLAFEQFTRDQAAAFERIARRTRGTHDADDLISEAWFIAVEIGKRRCAPVDLLNRAEQDQVLAWLYKRFVDYVGGKLKESIDADCDESRSWHDRLAAPDESDPLSQLLRTDDESGTSLPAKGFSQYSAYMLLLKRCEMNVVKLAEYLAVSFVTLRRRINDASDHADVQPSIFDTSESIDPDFVTRRSWMHTVWKGWQRTKGVFESWIPIPSDLRSRRQPVNTTALLI